MRNLIREAIEQNKYGVCKSDFYPGIFLNSSEWVTKNGRKPFIQWCPGSPGNGQIILRALNHLIDLYHINYMGLQNMLIISIIFNQIEFFLMLSTCL